jgi:hypothetical protein
MKVRVFPDKFYKSVATNVMGRILEGLFTAPPINSLALMGTCGGFNTVLNAEAEGITEAQQTLRVGLRLECFSC